MSEFGFKQEIWLYFIPIIWLLWYKFRTVNVIWPRWLPSITIHYPLLNSLGAETLQHEKKQMHFRQHNVLLSVLFSLLLLSLAQPVQYTGQIAERDNKQPIDMVLVIDTALSMSLSDYLINNKPVSRIGFARKELSEALDSYTGERFALLISGNPPALWLPLTKDIKVVKHEIGRITTFLGGRISDMGATLRLIEKQFANKSKNTSNSSDSAQVAIIISDGGTQVGDISPQTAAEQLSEKGFTVYVIAVGSVQPESAVLNTSSLLYEPANLDVLTKVAKAGKGQLFHARDHNDFKQAMATIVQLQRTSLQQSETRTDDNHSVDNKITQPWYYIPLLAAMLILLFLAVRYSQGSRDVS